MKFSLVMSTLGRKDEVDRSIASIVDQSYPDCRLFLCDQNTDDRLSALIADTKTRLDLTVVSSGRGLSRGRNASLRKILAEEMGAPDQEIIAFPDDDSYYPVGTLKFVADTLRDRPDLAGLTLRSVDETGSPTSQRSPQGHKVLNKWNLLKNEVAISYCIFVRRSFVQKAGLFDEDLGVGSGTPWGSGEESDFLLRGLNAGEKLEYTSGAVVHHPKKSAPEDAVRFSSYARGHGRVLKNNHFGLAYLAKDVFTALAAFLLRSMAQRKFLNSYLLRASGYMSGYFSK